MAVLYVKDQNGKFVPIPSLRGRKGDTPVRGVDYWTEYDIKQIKRYIDEEIANIEVESDVYVGKEEPDDQSIKVWINPDGKVTEPVYELIEKITLEEEVIISRTIEPDGTPYKFKSLLVKMVLPPEVENSNGMNIVFQMDDGSMVLAWMDGVTNSGKKQEAVCELLNVNGVFRIYLLLYADENIQSTLRSGYPAVKGTITKIFTVGAFKAMQTVEIWGVRA